MVGFTTSFLISNPAIMMSLPSIVLSLFGISGDNIAVLGRYAEGVGYINLAQKLGASYFQIATEVWNTMTTIQQWTANQQFLDDMIAQGKEFVVSNNAYDALAHAPDSDFCQRNILSA